MTRLYLAVMYAICLLRGHRAGIDLPIHQAGGVITVHLGFCTRCGRDRPRKDVGA